jgi:ribosomal-protein-alanine N-acetyltransferase
MNFSDVFLPGKIVSLCHPNVELDITNGQWHSWFNDQNITKYLEHGVRSINAIDEAQIIRSDLAKTSNLILSIVGNESGEIFGVISIKDINHLLMRGEIALVTNNECLPGAALEAMALMTNHAFDRLNLQKLYAGQHEGLWKWVNTLALIGYRIEGIRRCQGYRNGKPYDVILTGVTANDYYKLKFDRDGDILSGDALMLSKKRCKDNKAEELKKILNDFNLDYV